MGGISFLSDENIARGLTEFLRNEGHNVKDIKDEGLFGIPDEEVLSIAKEDNRVILTHDREFGGILNDPLKFKGIIFIRYSNQSPSNVIKKFSLDLDKIKEKIQDSVIVLYDKYSSIYESE